MRLALRSVAQRPRKRPVCLAAAQPDRAYRLTHALPSVDGAQSVRQQDRTPIRTRHTQVAACPHAWQKPVR